MVNQNRHDIRGSLWNRWDLHFHTPSSYDYEDKSLTNEQLLFPLLSTKVSVVAVTDHHVINVERIKELQALGKDSITILPGIELRDDHGGHQHIHYIGMFPDDCDLKHVWTILQGRLNLTAKGVSQQGGDEKLFF
jgi:exonuclease SbcC